MKEQQSLSYGSYVLVWLALVVLTSVTVTIAGMHLGALSIATAIFIALIKGSLVVYYFMNLKNEDVMFRVMLLVALVTLTVIMVFTFFDISFR